MPHLIVEYTANLSPIEQRGTLLALNQALVDSCEFNEADIKSRAIQCDDFLIGVQTTSRGFLHVKLHILSGRSAETKKRLSQQLLATLTHLFKPQVGVETQLCVEVIDIDRDSYSKTVV